MSTPDGTVWPLPCGLMVAALRSAAEDGWHVALLDALDSSATIVGFHDVREVAEHHAERAWLDTIADVARKITTG